MNINRFINQKAMFNVQDVKWVHCGIDKAKEQGKRYTEAWAYRYHIERSNMHADSPFYTGWSHNSRLRRIQKIQEMIEYAKRAGEQLTFF